MLHLPEQIRPHPGHRLLSDLIQQPILHIHRNNPHQVYNHKYPQHPYQTGKICGQNIFVDDRPQQIRSSQISGYANYNQDTDYNKQHPVAHQISRQPDQSPFPGLGPRLIFQMISVCHN